MLTIPDQFGSYPSSMCSTRPAPELRPLILIVDDTPASVEVLASVLEETYRVKYAVSGRLALELARGHETPDLILLDVMMPGIDGYEVCRCLKQDMATRDIPVIFMTALNSVRDQVRSFEAGAVDFLTKPVQIEGVLARVALHLRLYQQQHELERYRHDLERLVKQLRHLAVEATLTEERERQAIARDLHDDLGQTLHVVRIKLDSLLPAVEQGTRDALLDLVSMIVEASRMVRSLTSQLSPPVLMELGLAPALDWLAEEMERNYGLLVVVEDDGTPKALGAAQAAILFRAVRELLINVAKHASAHRAYVAVQSVSGNLLLVVGDDGVGIADPKAALTTGSGYGLPSVRERIALLGGTMNISAAAGAGTTIVLKMPLEPPTDRASEVIA